MAKVYNNIAAVYKLHQQYPEALAALDTAMSITVARLGEMHVDVAYICTILDAGTTSSPLDKYDLVTPSQ